MIEPNCDMPWEVYLDWLQDQGNEDLRDINYHSLITVNYHSLSIIDDYEGEGDAHRYAQSRRSRPFCIGCYYVEFRGDCDEDGEYGYGEGCGLGGDGYGAGGLAWRRDIYV